MLMEQWNKGNKMLRAIGPKEDAVEYVDLMEERLRGMEQLSGTHITWYTHKNPYGCWICDMFLVAQRLIDSFREFLGPTAADATNVDGGSSESLESDALTTSDNEINDEHDFVEED